MLPSRVKLLQSVVLISPKYGAVDSVHIALMNRYIFITMQRAPSTSLTHRNFLSNHPHLPITHILVVWIVLAVTIYEYHCVVWILRFFDC